MSDEQQPIKSGAARPTGKRQLSGVATTSSQSYADKRVVRVEGKKMTPPLAAAWPLSRVKSHPK